MQMFDAFKQTHREIREFCMSVCFTIHMYISHSLNHNLFSHFLKQILQVQMNDYKYHYHMTTFDIEIHDLENLNYNFVNLTSYRIVDSSNPMVRHVLRDIERFSPKGKSILNKPNVIQVLISFKR